MLPSSCLTLLLILTWFHYTNASYRTLLNGRSRFENVSEVERFVLGLHRLGRLQAEALFGSQNITAADEESDTEGLLAQLDRQLPAKPDQLPYLFEGDMILTDEQLTAFLVDAEAAVATARQEPRSRRSLTSNPAVRWPMPIPYWIDTSTGVSTSAVAAGVARWQQLTCVTFRQMSRRPNAYESALQFIRGDGCYSYIGRTGGVQQVSIGSGCTQLGTVTHEIGHALGFYHEQARPERDNYVHIEAANIGAQYLGQFSKQPSYTVADYGILYDYGSVMHYDGYGFTSNGRPTITTRDPNYQATIGQREEPSFSDVKQINYAYCNSSCAQSQLPCEHGGYPDPKNCAVCRCPVGLSGTLCDRVQPSLSPSCGTGDLVATSTVQTLAVSGDADCFYRIKAPAGSRVLIAFSRVLFPNYAPCQVAYAEIKYRASMESAGFRLCGSRLPASVRSAGETAVIIYRGSAATQLVLQFRHDGTPTIPPIPATTTAPVVTTDESCPWSQCTSVCGGCGTQTRRCSQRTETRYCNLEACGGFICCPPFTLDPRTRYCSSSSSDGGSLPDTTPPPASARLGSFYPTAESYLTANSLQRL